MKQAIEAKNSNVSRYKGAVGADEVWLLLHSSFMFRVLPAATEPADDILQLLRLGCFLAPHDFSQIWFAELTNAGMPATRLFGAGLAHPTVSAEEYNRRFDPFPIDRHGSARPTIRQEGVREKYVQINLNNTSATLCLQPLDDRYNIDYGPLLANPQRNANLKNISWMWFDEDSEA